MLLALKYLVDILLVIWGSTFYGVPYVPTKSRLLKKMVEELNLKKGQKVVELGSGDGRVSVMIASKYEVEVLGVEKIRWLLFVSRIRALLSPKKGKVIFERKDLFEMSFKEIDVVYMYLLPNMIEELVVKFEKQLRKGGLIISFDYPVLSKKLELVKEMGEKQKLRMYRKI